MGDGGGPRVSEVFYYGSKFKIKIKKKCFGGGGGGAGISEFFHYESTFEI